MGQKSDSCLKISESAIYRRISDELVVIQLETGHFFYFSPETENFLDLFKEPTQLDHLLEGRSDKDDYISEFCDFLVENKILQKTKPPASAATNDPKKGSSDLSKPVFLRKGDKTLDEITFLCP